MENERQLTKCMIKRSYNIIKIVFSWKLFISVVVSNIIALCIMLPCLYVNYFVMSFILDILNIEFGILYTIAVIIIGIFTMIELLIIGACLSCIPIISNTFNKFRLWFNE